MLVEIVFLVALGIFTSAGDIKYGKIRNSYIALAVAFALVMNIGYFFSTPHYFSSFLINGAIALLVGLAFWFFNFISAGDAKLFFAYSAIIPVSAYKYGYVPLFPSFAILLNTLLIAFLLLFFRLLLVTDWSEKKLMLRRSLSWRVVQSAFLFLFGFLWFLDSVLYFLNLQQNIALAFALVFLSIFIINKKLKKYAILLPLSFSIARLLWDTAAILRFSFWVNFAYILVVFIFFIGFVSNLGRFMFTQKVPIMDLKEGMMPFEAVVLMGGEYKKAPLPLSVASKDGGYLIGGNALRIAKNDINRLKGLHEAGKLKFGHLLIQHTTYFAPLLFAGVIVTLLAHGNLTEYLKVSYFCANSAGISNGGAPINSELIERLCPEINLFRYLKLF